MKKVESRAFKQCCAQLTQAHDKNTGAWCGFEISFADYAKEISIISLPSLRRRDRKSKITPLEPSSLEWSVALVGYAMLATVAGTSVAVDGANTASPSGHELRGEQVGSGSDCVGKNTTQNPCESFSCCGYVHRCWMDHSARRHVTRWTAGLHCKLRVVAQQRIKQFSDILAFESVETVARSSPAAETQAAADGDDEAVYLRLCLNKVLFGQLDLQNWQSETRQIPAALVVDCRGVFDALARSSSSCLGLKDKKSGLEALALKQGLVECGTMQRWCHSVAQLGDVVTKRL